MNDCESVNVRTVRKMSSDHLLASTLDPIKLFAQKFVFFLAKQCIDLIVWVASQLTVFID